LQAPQLYFRVDTLALFIAHGLGKAIAMLPDAERVTSDTGISLDHADEIKLINFKRI